MIWGIAAAGFLGASARYMLGQALPTGEGASMPWTTLIINLSGSLLLGLLIGYTTRRRMSDWLREAAGTGFLGSFTTFGAFNAELLQLVRHEAIAIAAFYAVLSGIGGWLLARAGLRIGARGGEAS